jgi:hypothetical protein
MAYFNVIWRNLPGDNEEKHDTTHTWYRWLVTWTRFQLATAQHKSKSLTANQTSYKYLILLVDFYGCETRSLTLRGEYRLILQVRFKVLTAARVKITVFWDVAPCSLAEVYQRFGDACCLYHQGAHRPDDGGSKHLWNVGKLLPDYTSQVPRR